MDPLTQGVVGVTASQLVAQRSHKGIAALFGFLSGMAADLDVVIRSADDPLLALEYHRHFTHSLIFIPIGALICALLLKPVFSWLWPRWFKRAAISFKQVYYYCLAGYASHAVLDACTTYGTQLFWPFSNVRIAWNNVSVVDPLFTVPLLLLISFALVRQSRRIAVLASAYAVAYLSFGVWQNQRAESAALLLAQSRGHQAISLGVKPSFANLLVWKSVYEFDGRYYIDAIRVAQQSKVYPGGSTEKLDAAKHFAWLAADSQYARDIERFRWFSNGHLALDPRNPLRIIDVRYSLVPNRYDGMWGIELDPQADQAQHVAYNVERPQGEQMERAFSQLWSMILGR